MNCVLLLFIMLLSYAQRKIAAIFRSHVMIRISNAFNYTFCSVTRYVITHRKHNSSKESINSPFIIIIILHNKNGKVVYYIWMKFINWGGALIKTESSPGYARFGHSVTTLKCLGRSCPNTSTESIKGQNELLSASQSSTP